MIISRQKEFNEILQALKEERIFIIGCGTCAKKQRVGGEPEVIDMKKRLENRGKIITGWTVIKSTCSISSWKEVIEENPNMLKAEAFLVMSCGGGVSVVSEFSDIQVYPALDTESLGGVCRNEVVAEQCWMCGDCNIWLYGGVCPFIQCAKSLANGPCGGEREGKCEVDGRSCAWEKIFEKLKKLDRLENLDRIQMPRSHLRKKAAKQE